MATIDFTQQESKSHYDRFNLVIWQLLAGGDVGKEIMLAMSGDRSVQVSAACTIEGSNDGTNFFTLNDVTGAPLVFAGAGIKQILEITKWIRPTGVAGACLVTLLAKRQEA